MEIELPKIENRADFRMSNLRKRLSMQLSSSKLYAMLLIEATIFTFSLIVAYLLRFDFDLAPVHRAQIMHILPLLVPLKLALFFSLGLYRGMWRYSTIRDAWKIGYASLFSLLLLLGVVTLLNI